MKTDAIESSHVTRKLIPVLSLLTVCWLPAQVSSSEPIQQQLTEAQQRLRAAKSDEERRALLLQMEHIRSEAEKANDRTSASMARYVEARLYQALNEYDNAVKAFSEVATYRHTTGDRFGEAVALHNLAVTEWSSGQSQKALELYRSILALRRELKDDTGVAYTQYGIASCHWSIGEAPQALEAYRGALDVWTQLKNDRGIADTLSSMGLIYVQLGDLRRANSELTRALEIWLRLKEKTGEAYTRNNLALAAIAGGRFQAALDSLSPALPTLESTGDRHGQSYVLHNFGTTLAGLHREKDSIEYFQRSLQLKRELQDRWGEAYSLQALGEVFYATGDSVRAKDYIRQAIEIRRTVPDRTGLVTSLAAMARLEREENNLAAAKSDMAKAIALIEELRSRLVSEDLRATWFASKREYFDFHIDTLIRMGEDERALEVAESARARLLLDRLWDLVSGLRSEAAADLLAQEKNLQQQINATADVLHRIYSGPRKPEAVVSSERKLAQLLEKRKELRESIRRSSPRYAYLTEPPALRVRDIQGLLDRDSLLLSYFLGKERSHLWIVGSQSVKHHNLPAISKIDPIVRDAHSPDALRNLSNLLLSSAASEIRVRKPRRIIVETEGRTESVPFSALFLPGTNEPLIARYEIVRLPSASALAINRNQNALSKRTGKSALVLADPVYGPPDPRLPVNARKSSEADLPRLRFSMEEAQTIESLLPTSQRTIAVGFDASRKRVLNQPLRNFQLLHFASHTELNGEQPELSGLVLSRYDRNGQPIDGFVRLHEIYNLDLRSRLVVLSACRSTVGPYLRGEGLIGVTRGFLYAGASSVLATLWDIEDKPAAELIRLFYQGMIQEGLRPVAALRKAQNRLRADPAWNQTTYWAAFDLQGEWR